MDKDVTIDIINVLRGRSKTSSTICGEFWYHSNSGTVGITEDFRSLWTQGGE